MRKYAFLVLAVLASCHPAPALAQDEIRVPGRGPVRVGVSPSRDAAGSSQIEVLRFDLGPEWYSTHQLAAGYAWTARGYIYPFGTFTSRPAAMPARSACVIPDDVAPIGSYVIRGRTGGPADHIADYALNFTSVRPVVQYFFGGQVFAGLDSDGFPLTLVVDGTSSRGSLYPAQVQREDNWLSHSCSVLHSDGFPCQWTSLQGYTLPFAEGARRFLYEFTPRSSQCFGGSVTIFILP